MVVDRDRANSNDRGYTWRWHKARTTYLKNHPLCVKCQDDGRISAASVVDHIIPHKGDQSLFWSPTNWQSLCRAHHDRDKQREERGRAPQRIGDDGWPL